MIPKEIAKATLFKVVLNNDNEINARMARASLYNEIICQGIQIIKKLGKQSRRGDDLIG